MGEIIQDRVEWDVWNRVAAGYQGNRRLTAYVGLTVLAGVGLLWLRAPSSPILSVSFLLWFLFSLAAELLWLQTPTGDASDSMASTFNVAVLYLFGSGLSLWIIGLSVLIATRFIQKRDWIHSFFGLGQIVLTAYVAGALFEVLAGGTGSIGHFSAFLPIPTISYISLGYPGALMFFPAFRLLGALVLCMVAYFFVNTLLVAGAVSLERGTAILPTLQTNYLYRNAVLSSAALFALSPILLISYLSLGYPGVLLFFLPLVIVKKQNSEYIALQRAEQQKIAMERMAAAGQIAGAVSHEMNNYLTVLSGRTELLRRKWQKAGIHDYDRDGEILWTQIGRLQTMARQMTEFARNKMEVSVFDLNVLCREMVEFLGPQNDFDNVRLDLVLEEGLPLAKADRGQIQQVLLNLYKNAADAMRDAGTEGREIRVRTSWERTYLRVEVEDNGPGVPRSAVARIFELGFTSKEYGHGFGLATCLKILQNHKGRIWVEPRPGGGARFILTWPGAVSEPRAARAA
ncbi:MAG: sensor histidine kinase [Candidatus Eisenbacteria bacterium]|nr:HAMP domain-containing sensor histidine kinase [Candidatus Eisenbacteria bacterium]